MKFSTRTEIDAPATQVYALLTDFPRLERMLMRRGVAVARIPEAVPDASDGLAGTAWDIGFDWRGQARRFRLTVVAAEPGERLLLRGDSAPIDLAASAAVVALNRGRSRLLFETELRPRTVKARVLLQTARLSKATLDRRFDRTIADFISAGLRASGPQAAP